MAAPRAHPAPLAVMGAQPELHIQRVFAVSQQVGGLAAKIGDICRVDAAQPAKTQGRIVRRARKHLPADHGGGAPLGIQRPQYRSTGVSQRAAALFADGQGVGDLALVAKRGFKLRSRVDEALAQAFIFLHHQHLAVIGHGRLVGGARAGCIRQLADGTQQLARYPGAQQYGHRESQGAHQGNIEHGLLPAGVESAQ